VFTKSLSVHLSVLIISIYIQCLGQALFFFDFCLCTNCSAVLSLYEIISIFVFELYSFAGVVFSIAPLQSASSAVQMSTAMGEGSNSQSSRARGKSLADSAFQSLSTPPSQYDIGQRDFGSMDWSCQAHFVIVEIPLIGVGRIQANAAAKTCSTPSRSQTGLHCSPE